MIKRSITKEQFHAILDKAAQPVKKTVVKPTTKPTTKPVARKSAMGSRG